MKIEDSLPIHTETLVSELYARNDQRNHCVAYDGDEVFISDIFSPVC